MMNSTKYKGKTLDLVRELGFNNTIYGADGPAKEEIVFLGPHKERGEHATKEAIEEFIAYWERQIETAKMYLNNGRNNKTHEWLR